MKIAVLFAASFFIGSAANAACFGTEGFQSCSDSSGNRYTVSRFGDTTLMQGSNSRTGSRWSQNSQTMGDTTFHNGRDADGNSWRSTCTNGFCN